jgi:hypothetical protein
LAEVGGWPAALALDVHPGPSEVRLVVTDGVRLMTVMLPCALRVEGRVLVRGVAAPGARVRPRGVYMLSPTSN